MADLTLDITIDCDTAIQGGLVPVLDQANCCDVLCQTVAITGIWRWQENLPVGSGNLFGRTGAILFQKDTGELVAVNWNANRPADLLNCSDSAYFSGPFECSGGQCFWESSYGFAPACIPIENGDIYELKASWCPDCAEPLTVTFGIVGQPILRDVSLLGVCDAFCDASFNVVQAGVVMYDHCQEFGPPSSVTGFTMTCGALPPSQNTTAWSFQCPT